MARNLENGTVQEDGCHALRNVAFHCGVSSDDMVGADTRYVMG